MRRFELHRDEDKTGISGIGIVAEGVVFQDGSAVLRWRSQYKSTAVYNSMDDVKAIHGHEGQTRIVWIDNKAGEGPCELIDTLRNEIQVLRRR